MIIEVKDWKEEVQLAALRYAQEGFQSFQQAIDSCAGRMPNKSVENQTIVLDTFIDVLLSNTAMITVSYSRDLSTKFEDTLVLNFRRKFMELRNRSLGGEAEMEKMKIMQSEDKN